MNAAQREKVAADVSPAAGGEVIWGMSARRAQELPPYLSPPGADPSFAELAGPGPAPFSSLLLFYSCPDL